MFRAAGYETYYRGKWHISEMNILIPDVPAGEQSFDVSIGGVAAGLIDSKVCFRHQLGQKLRMRFVGSRLTKALHHGIHRET